MHARSCSYPARYYIEEDDDGWRVIDAWTACVTTINGRPMRGLSLDDADDLAALLSHVARPANAP